MKIEHIAMYVNDLEKMKVFYQQYFSAITNNKYYNSKTGLETYFLSFAEGARLEIMSRPEIINNEQKRFNSGYIHLAFTLGSKENVDKLTAQVKADGFEVLSEPRTTGDGYYESCFLDPEGNQIEIVA